MSFTFLFLAGNQNLPFYLYSALNALNASTKGLGISTMLQSPSSVKGPRSTAPSIYHGLPPSSVSARLPDFARMSSSGEPPQSFSLGLSSSGEPPRSFSPGLPQSQLVRTTYDIK